jgi:hypothetical protein
MRVGQHQFFGGAGDKGGDDAIDRTAAAGHQHAGLPGGDEGRVDASATRAGGRVDGHHLQYRRFNFLTQFVSCALECAFFRAYKFSARFPVREQCNKGKRRMCKIVKDLGAVVIVESDERPDKPPHPRTIICGGSRSYFTCLHKLPDGRWVRPPISVWPSDLFVTQAEAARILGIHPGNVSKRVSNSPEIMEDGKVNIIKLIKDRTNHPVRRAATNASAKRKKSNTAAHQLSHAQHGDPLSTRIDEYMGRVGWAPEDQIIADIQDAMPGVTEREIRAVLRDPNRFQLRPDESGRMGYGIWSH